MKNIFKFLTVALTVGSLSTGTLALASWFDDNRIDENATNTFRKESSQTEAQQRMHVKNTPVPKLTQSQERVNITKRLTTFNNADKVSYIYLVSFGKVMAFYTIKGKVSSVNSYLTTDLQLVDGHGNQCNSNSINCYPVPSPDLDGSYGSNGDGIFFFTTEGAYVEWNGEYMLADQPLKLATPPEMVVIKK